MPQCQRRQHFSIEGQTESERLENGRNLKGIWIIEKLIWDGKGQTTKNIGRIGKKN